MIIQEYVRAMVAQNGFGANVQGAEYSPRRGLRFCVTLRNREILPWAKENLNGRRYGDLKIALGAADVVIQGCVTGGKVDISKTVFPCRGFVTTVGNDAIRKVAEEVQAQMKALLKPLEADCERLHQAGAIEAHRVREINLGNTRLVFTESPCRDFSLAWFPEPGEVLMALLNGARYFNLKVELFREGFRLAERQIEGVVDHGAGGFAGHYGGIGRDLVRDAVLQARCRIPETTAALAASFN